jgi:hypothetical protein
MMSSGKSKVELVADLRAQADAWRAVARQLSLRTEREMALAQARHYDTLADRLEAEARDEQG